MSSAESNGGHVIALSDSSGDTVQTYEYSVFGEVFVEDASQPGRKASLQKKSSCHVPESYLMDGKSSIYTVVEVVVVKRVCGLKSRNLWRQASVLG